MFITAKVKYNAVPITTMINSRQGKALKSFGGVVMTSAYNDAINSFGGWQMAYKEFIDAVQNEQVKAGTIRTDTLEHMVAKGDIAMEDFKVIGKKDYADFPFVCSTKLYPEWPLGKVAATDDTISEISEISSVINNVNELVGTIAAAVEEQSVTAGDISNNVNEAANGIVEVNENVAQASMVANEIAKDIADVSQVSEEAKEGSLRLQESSRELKGTLRVLAGKLINFIWINWRKRTQPIAPCDALKVLSENLEKSSKTLTSLFRCFIAVIIVPEQKHGY